MKGFYRKKIGYSKTLKMIYVNWCAKNGYKYITGHVKKGISTKFKGNISIITQVENWQGTNRTFEYYRRTLSP